MRALLSVIVSAWAIACAADGSSLEVRVCDADGGPVADAVVCVYQAGRRAEVPGQPVEIVQQDREFRPRVTVLPVGGTVKFPNLDTVAHHVYSFSPAKTFDLPLYTGAPPEGAVFDRPGIVALGCNIHDWMLAHVYVTDASCFGRTDSNGVARIEGMVAGDATVRVWHARLRGAEPEQAVVVGDAAEAAFELNLRPEPRRRGAPRVGGGGGYR